MRRVGSLVAVVLSICLLAGCTLERPPGPSPLRYRDQVFTDYTVTRDLQYGSAPHQETGQPVTLRLDLYQPAGDNATRRPALVWVHGGGYTAGDKAGGVATDIGPTFARLGYVVASINYRLISSGCGGSNIRPDCVIAAINAQHDAQAAVRWLRDNAATYRIDSARIAMGGESAGAITSTLVGLRPDDPGDSGNPGHASNIGAFVSISGGSPGGGFASAGDAPGLLFHGTADNVVPSQWSVDTAVALLNAGVPAFLQLQEGAGHVPYVQFRNLYVEQTNYFLYSFLDLAHAQGQPIAAARAFDRQLPELRRRYPRFARRLSRLRSSYPAYTKRMRGASPRRAGSRRHPSARRRPSEPSGASRRSPSSSTASG
jgi:predicted esterase